MSYWRDGDPVIGMETDNGFPLRFTWQGQVHTVSAIANVWRLDDAWWAQRVWQDRFKLITTAGILLILAHDLMSDDWRVIRTYD